MKKISPARLLRTPIASLAFSEGFNRMAAANGFFTLDDLLSVHLSGLLKKKDFTPELQQELMLYLFEHQLVQYLKQS